MSINSPIRIGQGYDLHRLAPGKEIILAGVCLPCAFSIVAVSDGDVVLHALSNACLGTIGAGDIGDHFPDTDPSNVNLCSKVILQKSMQLMAAKKVTLLQVDITIIAQQPKISPFKQQLNHSLSQLLQLPLDRVNVQATTTEGLGVIGNAQAIACSATVLASESP